LETAAYELESEPGTVVEVQRKRLEAVTAFLETCRTDPGLARESVRRQAEFEAAGAAKRAVDLIEIYEAGRIRGVTGGEPLARLERRQDVPSFRDYLVLALCRREAFEKTHDPASRGEELATAFRVEEDIAPVLDRVDRDLFRIQFAHGSGMRILDDEEWDQLAGEGK
jgi:hypothetical protein